MAESNKSTPRDFFMYFLVTGTLYASIASFIALLFAYIDVLHPDRLYPCYTCSLDQIRWSSATLLVVFPVFVYLFRRLRKEFIADPEKRELKVRKWLMYFTLFLAAVTIVVDLVTLVYNFYSGELTLRFSLKTLVVLVVAAAVFSYYTWDLKKKSVDQAKTRMIAWLTTLAVVAAIVGGFFIVGSPAQQRERRFDETRVNDLQIIQGQTFNYWIQKGRLPASLNDLRDSISGFIPPTDPQTNEQYDYKTTGTLNFQLCATFKTENNDSQANPYPYSKFTEPYTLSIPRPDTLNQSWNHGVGKVCFNRVIDPELYPRKQ